MPLSWRDQEQKMSSSCIWLNRRSRKLDPIERSRRHSTTYILCQQSLHECWTEVLKDREGRTHLPSHRKKTEVMLPCLYYLDYDQLVHWETFEEVRETRSHVTLGKRAKQVRYPIWAPYCLKKVGPCWLHHRMHHRSGKRRGNILQHDDEQGPWILNVDGSSNETRAEQA